MPALLHRARRTHGSRVRRVALLLAASVAAALAADAPARADSIAYVQAGDVWLASPDGTQRRQVTRTGGYAAVSQADDGVMIALAAGERLHRLSRTGAVLADFPTYVSDGAPEPGPVNRFHGPFAPAISPDGTKVAFEWFNDSYEDAPGCSATSVPPCAVFSQRQGIGISRADGYTGPEAYGLMTGWIFPHWMSESVLLRSFSGTVFTDDAVFTAVGPGLADRVLDPWMFDDQQGFGVDDVELSRDHTTVVGVAGQADEELRIYRTTIPPYGAPDWNHQPFHVGNVPVVERCATLAGGRFASPSLAPDARGLAYEAPDGVHVVALPPLGAGCAAPGADRLLAPGASGPDWGPADVGTAPGAAGPGTPATRVRLAARRAALGTALRRGIVVTVTGARPGTVRLRALRAGRVVARGSAPAGADGRARVRLRFTAAAKRSLRPARRVVLSVRGATASARVVLRR
jgi:hypothetical protein